LLEFLPGTAVKLAVRLPRLPLDMARLLRKPQGLSITGASTPPKEIAVA